MLSATRPFLAVYALRAGTGAAQAWGNINPFAIGDVHQADGVFTGTIARYARIKRDPTALLGPFGRLTIEVAEAIKGSVSRRVELAWYNSTFGIPGQRRTDVPLLVAAFRVDEDMPLPVWRVLQTPCAPPILLSETPRNRADVRKALLGEPVLPGGYFALQIAALFRRQAQAARAYGASMTGKAALAVLAAVLTALGLAQGRLSRRWN